MIFRDNYQKLLIFQSNDILQYLAIFNDILTIFDDGKLSPKKYRQISLFSV